MSRTTRTNRPNGAASKGCRIAAITAREDRKAHRYGWGI